MLTNLHVKNLALIEETDIEFGKGLNILTGETGAGKSILLGSVNLALGGKAASDIIGRYGEIKRQGGSIVICSMNNTIKKVFNISGLKRICNVANDEVSADKILGVIA